MKGRYGLFHIVSSKINIYQTLSIIFSVELIAHIWFVVLNLALDIKNGLEAQQS